MNETVGCVALIAAIITIFVFATGIVSLPQLLGKLAEPTGSYDPTNYDLETDPLYYCKKDICHDLCFTNRFDDMQRVEDCARNTKAAREKYKDWLNQKPTLDLDAF